MTRNLRWFTLACLTLTRCDTAPPTAANPGRLLASISDGAHSRGNPHFFFLPPMVSEPTVNGTFDGTLGPRVVICDWNGTDCVVPVLAEFTTTTGPGSETVRLSAGEELYIVNWHTDQFNLNPSKLYRVRVLVGSTELGHADVKPVRTGGELNNVDTQELVPLLNGRTLPIKFRIELGGICTPPPPGLVAWWPGDGNAVDIAGGHHGVLRNGVTFATGFVGQAFTFDGLDDWVEVAHDPAFHPDQSSGFTIDAWVNVASRAGYHLVDKSHAPEGTEWAFQGVHTVQFHRGPNRNTNVGEIDLGLAAGATPSEPEPPEPFVHVGTVTPVNDAQWHHLTATWDGLTMRMYLDAALKESVAFSGGVLANTLPLQIGFSARTGSSPLNGRIDELEIFARGLTTFEVQRIFSAGANGKCKTL